MKLPASMKHKKRRQCEVPVHTGEDFLSPGHRPNKAWMTTGKSGSGCWQKDCLGRGSWDWTSWPLRALPALGLSVKGSCPQTISPNCKRTLCPTKPGSKCGVPYFKNITHQEKQVPKKRDLWLQATYKPQFESTLAFPKFLFLTMWTSKCKWQ